MRILYVSYMHPAVAPGGAQQIAYELFRASQARGHQAVLISALEVAHEAEYGKPGAPIVPVPGEADQFFFFPQHYDYTHLSVEDWRSVQFFGELVGRLQPEVIHFHHYHRIGLETVRAARLAAPRAVIALTLHEMMAICLADGQMLKRPSRALCHAASPLACHGCFPEMRPEVFTLRKARLQAMLAECDTFVFPSEFLAERYMDWGLPAERCAVIPNGQADLAPAANRQQHSPALNRFGFFGQFIDNKGVDVILDALILLAQGRRVPAAGIVVEVNGGNKHYASPAFLEGVAKKIAEIDRLNVGPIAIVDRGGYAREELAGRMRTCDWVLVPSTWWEVFGLVVSEAWMFGRPVVVSDIGGLGERVTHGVDGLKVPARDAAALADVMAAVVGDEPLWRRLQAGIRPGWSAGDMLEAPLRLWAETAPAAAAAAPPRRPAARPGP